MKYLLKEVVALLLLIIMPLSLVSANAVNIVSANTETIAPAYADMTSPAISVTPVNKDMRGLWVATVVNTDYPSKPTTDTATLENEALKILDFARDSGFNAVFLQVRPTEDAFYKSSYFPWSKYLTGTQGEAPDGGFDPLAFWVTEAHSRGLELHAWVNPYRITKRTSREPKPDVNSLYVSHPARLHPDWVVRYTDNNLYFNPGIPEVQKLVTDGVLEIVNNYDVDGIHFDDYFYPGKNFDDSSTFAAFGRGYSSIGNWRRDNVTKLISDVSKAIKATGRDVSFGISPFGIWANKESNPLGSDTLGYESNYDQYADTRKWVKDGIIDYIAPQLYWNIGYSIADYSKLLSWWKNTVNGTAVKLYIGQAAYRAGNSSSASPWYGISEIEKQLDLNRNTPEVKGSIFYNYSSLAENPGLAAAIKAIYEKKDGIVASSPVTVSRPSSNIKTSYSQYYLNGTSDPGRDLYLNGHLVENRSSKGYFGVLVDLSKGSNIFTLSQEGSYVTHVIYRSSGSSEPYKMSRSEIISSSVFPQSQEYGLPGEKITLTCQAPAGSKVTVRIGDKTYVMKTASTYSSGSMYPAKYTYVYTLPSYSGTPRVINLEAPVYTMSYKGSINSRIAPGKIGVIMRGAPFYAEVAKDGIDTFYVPYSGDGSEYILQKGMSDYVTGMTGGYVRLSSGLWVRKTSITTYASKARLSPAVKSAVYNTGERWDTLILDYPSSLAAIAGFDGDKLAVNISAASSGVIPKLPADALFSSAEFKKTVNQGQYILNIKPGQKIEGYYIEKTSSGIILHIKKQIKTSDPVRPLTGIKIMLDPGHGGNEYGAVGPLGFSYSEKNINLRTALKLRTQLELLGAEVLMTRTTDATVSLSDRLEASRKALPDMFVSIHANSMEDNVDISKIKGFSVHYKEALAKPLAGVLLNQAAEIGRVNKGIHWNNFYVVRATWTPSVLVENGFVPNPVEFELQTDEDEQTRLAESLANGIVKYFTK